MGVLIEDFIKREQIDWNFYPSLTSFEYEKMPGEIKILVEYLNEKFSVWYSDNLYQENPFSHDWRFKEEEKVSDIEKIQAIIAHTNSLMLQGKGYDILGIITNDDKYRLSASENFFDYFLINTKTSEHNYSLIESLNRALYLLHYLKKRKQIKEWGLKLYNEVEYKDEEQKFIISFYFAKFLQSIEKSLLKEFIPYIIEVLNNNTDIGKIHIEVTEIIINYYKSINDEGNIEQWKMAYCSYCEIYAERTSPHGYYYLEKAIKKLDDGKHLEKINELRFLIDEQQRKMYDAMPMQSVPFDKKIINSLEKERKRIVELLKKLPNGTVQLLWFLKECGALALKEIEKDRERRKSSLVDLANHIVFDEDKTILYESSKATPGEKEEYEIGRAYQLHYSIQHGILLRPFLDNLKMDEEFKSTLMEVCGHNLFIPKSRGKIVYEILLDGLNRNIRRATFGLISQFEYGLREYLKIHKKQYPTIKKGGETYNIDLNNILVNKEKNQVFRQHIVEILGEDLTQELEFLTCRPLASNLRNRNYHDGYGDTDCYKIEELVLFFMIIKSYCLGYDAEINIEGKKEKK